MRRTVQDVWDDPQPGDRINIDGREREVEQIYWDSLQWVENDCVYRDVRYSSWRNYRRRASVTHVMQFEEATDA